VCRLREVFQPGEDYKMAVQEIVEYFPSMCVLGWICDQRCGVYIVGFNSIPSFQKKTFKVQNSSTIGTCQEFNIIIRSPNFKL